jgi:hypothetical protein
MVVDFPAAEIKVFPWQMPSIPWQLPKEKWISPWWWPAWLVQKGTMISHLLASCLISILLFLSKISILVAIVIERILGLVLMLAVCDLELCCFIQILYRTWRSSMASSEQPVCKKDISFLNRGQVDWKTSLW